MDENKQDIPIRKIRCPKCGQEPYGLLELWKDHSLAFEVKDGVRTREGYTSMGEPYAVEAQCRCGHVWKLRGVTQIWGVDKG